MCPPCRAAPCVDGRVLPRVLQGHRDPSRAGSLFSGAHGFQPTSFITACRETTSECGGAPCQRPSVDSAAIPRGVPPHDRWPRHVYALNAYTRLCWRSI